MMQIMELDIITRLIQLCVVDGKHCVWMRQGENKMQASFIMTNMAIWSGFMVKVNEGSHFHSCKHDCSTFLR